MLGKRRAIFVGLGAAGSGVLADFRRQKGAVVAGVVEPSATTVRRQELPAEIPVFSDLAQALQRADADIAFISSPSSEHAAQFIACARHGLHVWVEKPIALTLEDACAMAAAAREAKIKCVTPFGSFVHYFLADAIELARSGRIGRVIQIEAIGSGSYGYASEGQEYHYAVKRPEVSGGWILHHFCHMVDWATQMAGRVESVYCQTISTIPDPRPHQEEAVTAILRFQNGATATLTENQLRHVHLRHAIMGERGGQFIAQSPESRGSDPFVTIETAFGKEATRQVLDFEAYTRAVAARPSGVERFLNAIENDLPSPVPIERAIENIEICMALRESARTGAVVKLAPTEGVS